VTAAASFDSLRASSAPARGEDGRSVTESTQAAGTAFIKRLKRRAENQELISGPAVAQTQMAAFREWEQDSGERFLGLRKIHHPALAVNMIPVSNSYWLSAHLPNAVLLTYPARLAFQFHEPFYRTRCRVPRLGVGVRALLRGNASPLVADSIEIGEAPKQNRPMRNDTHETAHAVCPGIGAPLAEIDWTSVYASQPMNPRNPRKTGDLFMSKTTPEQNKALVLEAFDTLFNKRDYAAAERYWSDRYIQHSAPVPSGRIACRSG